MHRRRSARSAATSAESRRSVAHLPILSCVIRGKRPTRVLVGALAALAVLVVAFAAAAFALAGAGVEADSSALARVDVQAFGGTVERVSAKGPSGKPIPVSFHDGRLVPKRRLEPGTPVSVEVVVRRPGWIGWLAGSEHRERLTLRAPEAHVKARWLTVGKSGTPRVSFDRSGPRGRLRPAGRIEAPPLRPAPQLGRPRLRSRGRLGRRRRRPALLGATGPLPERHLVPGDRLADPRRQSRRRAPTSRPRRRCASPSRSRSTKCSARRRAEL